MISTVQYGSACDSLLNVCAAEPPPQQGMCTMLASLQV